MYTKPSARATCCAFETPPRALAFRAAEAQAGVEGALKPLAGVRARAAGLAAAPSEANYLERV